VEDEVGEGRLKIRNISTGHLYQYFNHKLINMTLNCINISTGHLYVKSDVYGFGVVLLEILTGMRAFDPKRPTGQHNLVLWTKPLLSSKKKLKKIMDTKIEGQYSLEAAWQAAQLTLKCLKSVPEERPSMKDVVEALEAIEAIQNPQFAVYISTTPSAGS